MAPVVARWQSASPAFHAALRMVAGFLIIWPGTDALFGYPMAMPGGGTAAVGSQAWIGAVLQVAGGSLMIAGFRTRLVAFVLSGEMAVAYWQFHAPGGPWPVVNGGMSAALFCFVFLFFSAAGAGPLSIDAWRGARSDA